MGLLLRCLTAPACTIAMVCLGQVGVTSAARAQGLLPYVPPLDRDRLEQRGVQLADEASQQAQIPAALGRAEVAAWLAPENSQVLRLLGGLYLRTGQLERATTTLEAARRHGDDRDGTLLFALGAAYLQGKRYGDAESTLQAALALDPTSISGWFDLGNTFIKLGRWDDAIDGFQAALALDDSFWPAINNIGLVRYEQGDAAAALERWEQSLGLDATAVEPSLAIAVVRYVQNQCDRAANQTQEACIAAIARGERALVTDAQYRRIDFLQENLWGDRLLGDVRRFFQHPRIRDLVADANGPDRPEQSMDRRQ